MVRPPPLASNRLAEARYAHAAEERAVVAAPVMVRRWQWLHPWLCRRTDQIASRIGQAEIRSRSKQARAPPATSADAAPSSRRRSPDARPKRRRLIPLGYDAQQFTVQIVDQRASAQRDLGSLPGQMPVARRHAHRPARQSGFRQLRQPSTRAWLVAADEARDLRHAGVRMVTHRRDQRPVRRFPLRKAGAADAPPAPAALDQILRPHVRRIADNWGSGHESALYAPFTRTKTEFKERVPVPLPSDSPESRGPRSRAASSPMWKVRELQMSAAGREQAPRNFRSRR